MSISNFVPAYDSIARRILTTPEQARINLETTIAIERTAASGKTLHLPLQMEE